MSIGIPRMKLAEAIKENLVEYNRDDLEALVGVAQRVTGMQSSCPIGTTRPQEKRE